jgi:hypothetical protein
MGGGSRNYLDDGKVKGKEWVCRGASEKKRWGEESFWVWVWWDGYIIALFPWIRSKPQTFGFEDKVEERKVKGRESERRE